MARCLISSAAQIEKGLQQWSSEFSYDSDVMQKNTTSWVDSQCLHCHLNCPAISLHDFGIDGKQFGSISL